MLIVEIKTARFNTVDSADKVRKECARLLRNLANRLLEQEDEGDIRDKNRTSIGTYKLTQD